MQLSSQRVSIRKEHRSEAGAGPRSMVSVEYLRFAHEAVGGRGGKRSGTVFSTTNSCSAEEQFPRDFPVVARQLEHSRTNLLAIPQIPVHWQVTLSNTRQTLSICLRLQPSACTLVHRQSSKTVAKRMSTFPTADLKIRPPPRKGLLTRHARPSHPVDARRRWSGGEHRGRKIESSVFLAGKRRIPVALD